MNELTYAKSADLYTIHRMRDSMDVHEEELKKVADLAATKTSSAANQSDGRL